MPLPDYQSLMAPVICALADGSDDSLAELRSVLTERFGLNEEDLRAKIPERFAWPPGHRDGGNDRRLCHVPDYSAGLLNFSTASAPVSDETRSSVQGPELTSPSLPNPAHWPFIRCPEGPTVSWIAP